MESGQNPGDKSKHNRYSHHDQGREEEPSFRFQQKDINKPSLVGCRGRQICQEWILHSSWAPQHLEQRPHTRAQPRIDSAVLSLWRTDIVAGQAQDLLESVVVGLHHCNIVAHSTGPPCVVTADYTGADPPGLVLAPSLSQDTNETTCRNTVLVRQHVRRRRRVVREQRDIPRRLIGESPSRPCSELQSAGISGIHWVRGVRGDQNCWYLEWGGGCVR